MRTERRLFGLALTRLSVPVAILMAVLLLLSVAALARVQAAAAPEEVTGAPGRGRIPVAPSSVRFRGARTLVAGDSSVYTATVYPADVTLPITYTWQVDDYRDWGVTLPTTVSARSLRWSNPGTKYIRVIAENAAGRTSGYTWVEVVSRAQADLTVTDVWYEGSTIYYQLFNQGDAEAPAGHTTHLNVDGTAMTHRVPTAIPPGRRLIRSFAATPRCSGTSDNVRVTVDLNNDVSESDEGNNVRYETWYCDRVAPIITLRPRATGITQDQAFITWQTNEPASSAVYYDDVPRRLGNVETDFSASTEHTLTLTSLTPGTVYQYKVRSQDSGKNTVDSAIHTFETLPTATEPPTPTIGMAAAADAPGYYRITAEVTDTTHIDRVEFYLNGTLVGTDYSASAPPTTLQGGMAPSLGSKKTYEALISPLDLGYTRKSFNNIQQEMQVTVVTPHSTAKSIVDYYTEDRPITVDVELLHPDPGEAIGVDAADTMAATVFAAQYHWGCQYGASSSAGATCGDIAKPVAAMRVYLDDALLDTIDPANHEDFVYSLDIPVSPSDPSPRTIKVEVDDDDGGTHSDEVDYSIVDTRPQVSVSRAVIKRDTYFDVKLTIANDASSIYAASIDYVVDNYSGFQAVGQETTLFDAIPEYDPTTGESTLTIDFKGIEDCVHLNPGTELEVTYQLVPVLYEDAVERHIGEQDVLLRLLDDDADTSFDPGHYLMTGWSDDAIDDADYVIVTHPERLHTHASSLGDPDELLAEMAHLAVLRDGVLGYLSTGDDPGILDGLISEGGAWTQQLHPSFAEPFNGYMLIVGESEIVPAWRSDELDVDLSDQPYSNRVLSGYGLGYLGDMPSLVVGRAVGDNVTRLLRPIQTSIRVAEGESGYGFDRSKALVYSGIEADYFIEQVNELGTLTDGMYGTANVFHERPYVISYTITAFDIVAHDRIAAGKLYNAPTDYVVYASVQNDNVQIMDGDGNWVAGGAFDVPGLQPGDQMLVEDVDGSGLEQIVIAFGETGEVKVYDPDGDVVSVFDAGFDPYDGLAVCDIDDDGAEEIVRASVGDTDNVAVYDSSGTLEQQLSADFGASYAMACGKVAGGQPDRIMIARPGTSDEDKGEITVHKMSGGSLVVATGYEATFRAGGSLLIGDVVQQSSTQFGFGDEELVVAADKGDPDRYDWVSVRNNQGMQVRGSLPVKLDAYFGLGAGDVDGDGLDDIIMANPASGDIEVLDAFFTDTMYEEMEAAFPGTDLVIYRGHGSSSSMGALTTDRAPADFGNSNPLVWGPTCLSGKYETGFRFTEAMFESKAAAHIGATEVSGPTANYGGVTHFLDIWDPADDIGSTFVATEWNALLNLDSEYWVWEYNLYGDPKYGVVTPAARQAQTPRKIQITRAAPLAPADTLNLHVPDFEVDNTVDFQDQVSLPGGGVMAEVGEYPVLVWPVQVSYPAGSQVADVTLTARSGELLTTGLNIVRTPDITDGLSLEWSHAASEEDPTDYVPALDQQFDWFVLKNADGSSELMLRIYPFYYSPATTNAKFYQDYTFQVTTISNSVSIDHLMTDRQVYTQGLSVSAQMGVHNSGTAKDVTVAAEVLDAHGNPVQGLLLRSLHGLEGDATFDFAWDTTGAPAGDYRIAVTLSNADDQLLDAREANVRLGVREMAAHVSATPSAVKPGEDVEIVMSYDNVGTVSISGTVIIELQHTEGLTVVQQLRQAFTGLAPGASDTVTTTWKAAQDPTGTFTVLGYVAYDAKASTADPVQVKVEVGADSEIKVFLPMIVRE